MTASTPMASDQLAATPELLALEQAYSARCAGLARKLQRLFGENLVRYEALSLDDVGRPVEVVGTFGVQPDRPPEGRQADLGGGLDGEPRAPAGVYTQLHFHQGQVAIRVILVGQPAQYRHLGAAEAWVPPAEAALFSSQHWMSRERIPDPTAEAESASASSAGDRVP
jgi:hypothetical protein